VTNGAHQQTNTYLLQAGFPSCRPTNIVKALKGTAASLITDDSLIQCTNMG